LAQCQAAIRWADSLGRELLKAEHLVYLGLLAGMLSIAAGVVLFLLDPNVHSSLDGIWSSWVTMTHVGFGDVVPVSFLGRLLAAGLILFGLLLFTALVSVALIGRPPDIQQLGKSAGTGGEAGQILRELALINDRLKTLSKRCPCRRRAWRRAGSHPAVQRRSWGWALPVS
jgi:voltage-gated potassium channel